MQSSALGPSSGHHRIWLGAFFFAKGVSGHFFEGSSEGLLGLLRLPGRESESIRPVQQIWWDQGFRRPSSAPLWASKKKCEKRFWAKTSFSTLCPLLSGGGLRPKHYQTFPGGAKKLRSLTKVSPLKCPKGGFRASWEPLLASLCSLPSSVAAAVSGRTKAESERPSGGQ